MKNVFYINLEHRTDRKISTETQLNNLGWKYERFNAIYNENGSLGCTLSHINVLKSAIQNNLEYCVILEDDILFKDLNLFRNFDKILEYEFDVFLLAGNLNKSKRKLEYSQGNIFKIHSVKTTTAYIVKSHYFEKLLFNFMEGYECLQQYPEFHIKYAIDMYWQNLQKTDKWLIKLPLKITQRASYSDIQKCDVNNEKKLLK